MRKEKLIKYSSMIFRIIIAATFLLAGSGKSQTDSTMASNFKNWNLGMNMMYVVGGFEVLGALFLLFPKTIIYGCYMLIIIMLGAVVIHILNFDELGFPLLNIALLICFCLIIYSKNYLKTANNIQLKKQNHEI
jgi:uncharacterized membrane protein YphA (DoxX/SURF4 family)